MNHKSFFYCTLYLNKNVCTRCFCVFLELKTLLEQTPTPSIPFLFPRIRDLKKNRKIGTINPFIVEGFGFVIRIIFQLKEFEFEFLFSGIFGFVIRSLFLQPHPYYWTLICRNTAFVFSSQNYFFFAFLCFFFFKKYSTK